MKLTPDGEDSGVVLCEKGRQLGMQVELTPCQGAHVKRSKFAQDVHFRKTFFMVPIDKYRLFVRSSVHTVEPRIRIR